jgi:serine/threonine-protein kinase
VENHGRIVAKDALMKRVWPETFVEEANLSHHVFTLRKALGDDKDETRYIETIPRRGYRFVAEVIGGPDQGAHPVTGEPSRVHGVITNGEPGLAVAVDTGTEQPAELSAASVAIDPHASMVAERDETDATTRAPRVALWRKASNAAAAVIVAIAAGYVAWTMKPASARPITRLLIPLADDDRLTPGPGVPLALSPDGTTLVYTANGRLYLRPLDQLDATPIPGVESPGLASARVPFFSPDGQWIGFWEAGHLKKVSISGGAPVTLCAFRSPPYGATWAADNTVLIGDGPRGVWRVSANGGTPERIITVDEGQRAHGPQLLPDGRTVLFTLAQSPSWDEAHVVVQSLDSGTRRPLITGGTDGRYLPTGHLVYALRGTLLAVPFHTASLEIEGRSQPLAEGVRRQAGRLSAGAQYAVSSNGTLAYVQSNDLPAPRRTLVWVDRQRREESIPADPLPYVHPRLAPDGSRLAVEIEDDDRDIWVWDFPRGALTRVISDRTLDVEPVWTPDGQRLIFLSGRKGVGLNLFWQAANGTGTADQLTDGSRIRGADTISPDGRSLVLRESDGKGNFDLTLLDLSDGRRDRPRSSGTRKLVQSRFMESNPEISPDGRWLAYQSDSSGAYEIYVQPFPDEAGHRWRVSTAGGREPLWAADGRELFYRSLTGAVMRVAIPAGSRWTAGAPTELFEGSSYALGGRYDVASSGRRTYDVSTDGRRFLMIKNPDARATMPAPARIVVVQNWFEELNSKVPK